MLSAIVERFGGGEKTKHRVRDLSSGGMRLDQPTGLRAGATVLVSVGALQAVGATVVWAEDGAAGLKFAELINPANALAKTVMAPAAVPTGDVRSIGATAGWMPRLDDPYRRR